MKRYKGFNRELASNVCKKWAEVEGTPNELNRFIENNELVEKILLELRGKRKEKISTTLSVFPRIEDKYEVPIFLNPELQLTKPVEYDIANVEIWYHPGQKDNCFFGGQTSINGDKILDYLIKKEELKRHLGYFDLLAIKERGLTFFRKYFLGLNVSAWKSCAYLITHGYIEKEISVPQLCENPRELWLRWIHLDGYWMHNNDPGRFK